MSLSEKLNQIKTIKNNIKQALADREVEVSTLTFADYPDAIEGIGGIDLYPIEERLFEILYPGLLDKIIANIFIINEDASNYTASETDDEDLLVDDFYNITNEVMA